MKVVTASDVFATAPSSATQAVVMDSGSISRIRFVVCLLPHAGVTSVGVRSWLSSVGVEQGLGVSGGNS
jgi:hypothetical protein